MENNIADFTLIVAGYDKPMDKFLEANIGLKSRFTNTIHFEDYSSDELVQIFKIFAKDYTLGIGVEDKLIEIFDQLKKNAIRLVDEEYINQFGNGRDARKVFGAIKTNLDKRLLKIDDLEKGDERLNIIELEDVEAL